MEAYQKNVTKQSLKDSFLDTQRMIAENPLLSEHTEKAVQKTVLYEEVDVQQVDPGSPMAKREITIKVTEDTTFSAAQKLVNQFDRVAVLNFASPVNPGGGVSIGAMAQEECLCRSSNLYPCLAKPELYKPYYEYHRNLEDSYYSDRLIYSTDVLVLKDDGEIPRLLEQDKWFAVDVITCGAPNLSNHRHINKRVLHNILSKRIEKIIEVAVKNNVSALVLGAFGCGAFMNPPDLVAEVFKSELDKFQYKDAGVLDTVVFAIKRKTNPCPNLIAFEQAFHTISEEANKLRFSDPYPLEQAFGRITMPSGRILNGDVEFNPYFKWQKENKYNGKQFSILGDSISTLAGYIPKGNACYYDEDKYRVAGVCSSKDTWWGAVINFLGGELLVNNSFSGSLVSGKLPSAGSSDERACALHVGGVPPDVVIIYLGMNDYLNGVRLGHEEKNAADGSINSYIEVNGFPIFNGKEDDVSINDFDYAYHIMLKKIKSNYPNAEIWCCTLCPGQEGKAGQCDVMSVFGGYNCKIITVASRNDCNVVDFGDYNLAYEGLDNVHPTRNGMMLLASIVIRHMDSSAAVLFNECKEGTHELVTSFGQTGGGTRYVCVKCAYTEWRSGCCFPSASVNNVVMDDSEDTGSFCINCGNRVALRSKLCAACGKSISSAIKKHSKGTCVHCGGKITGLLVKKCKSCRMPVY